MVPAEFETIVLRMLAKDPGQRFSSAGELLAELEALALIHGLIAAGAKTASAPPSPQPAESGSLEEIPPVVPAPQEADPLGLGNWTPPVEEQSVTARLNRNKAKPEQSPTRVRPEKPLMIGGSITESAGDWFGGLRRFRLLRRNLGKTEGYPQRNPKAKPIKRIPRTRRTSPSTGPILSAIHKIPSRSRASRWS